MIRILDNLWTLIEVQLQMLGVRTRDDRGQSTTEWAVLIGLGLAIAVAGGIIIMAKMRSNAENIPDNVNIGG